MPRLSKIGAAALASFGFSSTTGGTPVAITYLQVAGGAGGGSGWAGGGGAGGYLTGTTSLNPTLSYTVIVGAGGAGAPNDANGLRGTNGSNSQFGALTASVGGGGGGGYANQSGSTGGSGGGADQSGSVGVGTSLQGNNGGTGVNASVSNASGGGGGGSGSVGGNSSSGVGGTGGSGTSSSISGTATVYAGGGGGGCGTTGGTAGTGGAGAGGGGSSAGSSATANTGSGGGGGGGISGSVEPAGGNGGSGVVIISYLGAQKFGGGVVTSSGGYTIHTFNTSGTLAPLSSLIASYLIVAGGGAGGGGDGGGGGAGGLLSGSGTTIDTNSTYVVTVGSGGTGSANANGTNGSNSTFSMVSTAAVGGGYGAYSGNGGNGGSGGGTAGSIGALSGGTATSGQGNNGGSTPGIGTPTYPTPGGGGAGAVGGNASGSAGAGVAGNGGVGLTSSISGTSTYYAGGGGGSTATTGGTAGSGGNGGGGAGSNSTNGTAGTANTGGGGGGGGGSSSSGGNGGSGIVIISYAGSTQQMAGGTVTISGGNVIHTFTSSGYLTPLKLVNNSLRFRSSASAYLNRTPTGTGSQTTFTWSGWVKRGKLGVRQPLFGSGSTPSSIGIDIIFTAADVLQFELYASGTSYFIFSSAVYRDPAAWYHIVAVSDTTNATASNRMKLYVNGTQITVSSTNPTQNYAFPINTPSYPARIGQGYLYNGEYLDGYQTEINFIDGQALTPNSFGTFNSYGVWQPITYGGSYGTNGFYLPFNKIDNNITIGYDQSPNGNHFTSSGISVLATNPTITTITSSQSWTAPAGVTAINYLLVGGGGGGGSDNQWGTGGYGGNGGYVQYYSTTVTPGQSYSLVVGNGGSAAGSGGAGGTGGTTSGFGNSVSGGGGGAGVNTNNRRTGVGGYGASVNVYNSYNGGNGTYYPTTANYYAGGGGGRSIGGTPGIGGLGGGGNFQIAGTPNTGAGGGAGGGEGGYAGGTGVIIISYGTATPVAANTTVGNVQDSMLDVPTLTNANTANFCTYNPINCSPGIVGYVTDGNLNVSNAGSGATWNGGISGTIGVSSGKWYYECYPTGHTTSSSGIIGWAQSTIPMGTDQSAYLAQIGGFFIRNDISGACQRYLNFSTNTSIAAAVYANEIIGIAVDFTNGKFWISKNGTWYTGDPGSGTTPLFTFTPSGYYLPYVAAVRSDITTNTYPINFGQQPFQYTVPTGFLALNTYNI